MREVKFRAWLKGVFDEEGDMVYFDLFSTDGNYIIKEERSVREGDAVMQYTGLKDKNGVEIYEGDVVRYRDGVSHWDGGYTKPTEVKYEYGSFFPFCGCGGEYSMDVDDAVIIGNVHEHPELLEGSQC